MNAKEAIAVLEKLHPDTKVVIHLGEETTTQQQPVDNSLISGAVAGLVAASIIG